MEDHSTGNPDDHSSNIEHQKNRKQKIKLRMHKKWTNIRNGYLHHSGYYSSGGGGPVVVVAKYSFQHKIQLLLLDNHRSCLSITVDNTTTTEIFDDSYDKQWITVTIVILFQTKRLVYFLYVFFADANIQCYVMRI